eukprot:jgi/Mesvir1/8340/Mv12601-RA.1
MVERQVYGGSSRVPGMDLKAPPEWTFAEPEKPLGSSGVGSSGGAGSRLSHLARYWTTPLKLVVVSVTILVALVYFLDLKQISLLGRSQSDLVRSEREYAAGQASHQAHWGKHVPSLVVKQQPKKSAAYKRAHPHDSIAGGFQAVIAGGQSAREKKLQAQQRNPLR